MLEVKQLPQQHVLTWGKWRLEFSFQTDRWQHILWLQRSGKWTRCVSSIEGNPTQGWPGSPAYQHAYFEKINADIGEMQMLGQSGKNHYSGAMRFDTRQQMIDFDLAVRIHELPGLPLLLSSYEVLPPLGRDAADSGWELTLEQLPDQPAFQASWHLDSLPTKSLLNLTMADMTGIKLEKQRTTLRWKYQWRLQAGGAS